MHEQSVTTERDGKYTNRYGARSGARAGQPTDFTEYNSEEDAVSAAEKRSQNSPEDSPQYQGPPNPQDMAEVEQVEPEPISGVNHPNNTAIEPGNTRFNPSNFPVAQPVVPPGPERNSRDIPQDMEEATPSGGERSFAGEPARVAEATGGPSPTLGEAYEQSGFKAGKGRYAHIQPGESPSNMPPILKSVLGAIGLYDPKKDQELNELLHGQMALREGFYKGLIKRGAAMAEMPVSMEEAQSVMPGGQLPFAPTKEQMMEGPQPMLESGPAQGPGKPIVNPRAPLSPLQREKVTGVMEHPEREPVDIGKLTKASEALASGEPPDEPIVLTGQAAKTAADVAKERTKTPKNSTADIQQRAINYVTAADVKYFNPVDGKIHIPPAEQAIYAAQRILAKIDTAKETDPYKHLDTRTVGVLKGKGLEPTPENIETARKQADAEREAIYKKEQDARAKSLQGSELHNAIAGAKFGGKLYGELTAPQMKEVLDEVPKYDSQYKAMVEAAKIANRPLDTVTEQAMSAFDDYIRVAQHIKDDYSKDEIDKFVGYFSLPMNQLMQFVKGDEKFAAFMYDLGYLQKTFFESGGKQLTPMEREVLLLSTVTGRELSTADFMAKLEGGIRSSQFLKQTRLKYATQARKDIDAQADQPLGKEPPEISKAKASLQKGKKNLGIGE